MTFPRFSRQSPRTELLLWLALLALFVVFSVVGFWVSDHTHRPLEAVNKAVGLLVFNYPEDDNAWLDGAKFFAILVAFYGVVLVFFRKSLNRLAAFLIQKRPYDLWIVEAEGLDMPRPGARPLLLLPAGNGDDTGRALHGRRLAMLAGPPEGALERLDLKHCRRALVATGNDRRNMALAGELADRLAAARAADGDPVVQVEVSNRDLAVLFREQVLCAPDKVDIATFSRHEQLGKRLFAAHPFPGLYRELPESGDGFHIVLVGQGDMALELVYHIALLAHLPRQNPLTLHCLNADASGFRARLEKRYPGIGAIPRLRIEAHDLDAATLDFYTDAVWRLPNLTHIIIATDDPDRNLDIAVNLQDTTYIDETVDGSLRSLVLFVLDGATGLGAAIDRNEKAFARFYSFAVPHHPGEWLAADDALDAIARMIHLDYELGQHPERAPDPEVSRRAWLRASIADRDSCRSQAAHIDVKLAAMGLVKQSSDRPLDELLADNQRVFEQALGPHEVTAEMLADYRAEYFPQSFDTLLDRLARAEHDRWNAFHHLRGWRYDPKKNKAAKRHDCLLPLEEFATEAQRVSYQYDLLAVLRIPLYLAHAGYEIRPLG